MKRSTTSSEKPEAGIVNAAPAAPAAPAAVAASPSAAERRFAAELRRLTEPFAGWTGATFFIRGEDGAIVETVGAETDCDHTSENAGPAPGRIHCAETVRLDESAAPAAVVLCCPAGTPHPESSLATVVAGAREGFFRAEDESALLAELSASWESLQAVYDLNADFSSSQDLASMLSKITERTTAINPEIRAVLWLEEGDKLVPSATHGVHELRQRPKSVGLIGDVFMRRRSAIYNQPAEIRLDIEHEPEIRGAKRLAILPLTTRLSTYGVLVVWLESGTMMFDSRMMRLLDTLALQAAMVAENDRLVRDSIQNEKLKQEIDIGSKIQQTLLSGTIPGGLEGISIAAASISSQKIDGDFYEFIEHGPDCFDLIIGDVMGKGIPAALVGAATKNSFLRAIGRLQEEDRLFRPDSGRIVTWVNHDMTPKLMSLDSFVTACYSRFDLARRELTFVDCGHTKTIHYSYREREIRLLEGDNLPIGFSKREIFEERTVPFHEGDLFFFYSDGVTETKNPLGELFGDSRLGEFIRLIAGLEPDDIISTLIENLFRFSTEKRFNDDLTCVVVRCGEIPQEKAVSGGLSEEFDSRLDELARVREFARRAAASVPAVPLGEDAVAELELAVAEAFTNIVRHACGERAGSIIEFAAAPSPEGVELTFTYRGRGFDPEAVPEPVFDGSQDGGFGLFIIENCVDFVAYLTDKENRHSIRLIKNSSPQQDK